MKAHAPTLTLVAVVVVALAVCSAAGAFSTDPQSVDFGTVPLQATVSKSVTVTLDPGGVLIGSGDIFGNGSGQGVGPPFVGGGGGGTCSGVIGPATCTVMA